eukprot:SM000114S24143  [mRNA]  locus=s114:274273:279152:+ [translate_table: standard]
MRRLCDGRKAVGSPPPPLEWRFGQVFGERAVGEEVQEVDIISAIEFDRTGEHLATGDRGGRVVLFERFDSKEAKPRKELEKSDATSQRHIDYRYSTEFQSHEPEFDYLKSLEIEEKINKIRWCQISNGNRFLLSTNDKTIKLWKVCPRAQTFGHLVWSSAMRRARPDAGRRLRQVSEKKVKQVTGFNVQPAAAGSLPPAAAAAGAAAGSSGPPVSPRGIYPRMLANGFSSMSLAPRALSAPAISPSLHFPPGGFPSLQLPTVTMTETVLAPRCRRIYSNAHAYHINSIATNSDCETYISADDLRINLWNIEISDQSFNIVDIKPSNMEDLTEVITSAEFHPTDCHLLAYSSSKGSIRLLDMRQSALCDQHCKLYEELEAPGSRSFFSEIIASISDIKFARGGRYILARDYMTMKLWDLRKERHPVATFKVHEHLRAKLCDLYENDCIFDKFECCLSGDGQRTATGSYSNLFRVFGTATDSEEATTLEASKTPNMQALLTAAVNLEDLLAQEVVISYIYGMTLDIVDFLRWLLKETCAFLTVSCRRRRIQTTGRAGNRLANLARGRRDARRGNESPSSDSNGSVHDFASKLLHLAWHPTANVIACAASNSLYMYTA